MSVTNQPRIVAFIGASGSGKGVSINQELKELAPSRLVIWDPRNEYAKHAPAVSSVAALARALLAARGGPVRVRFVPDGNANLQEAFQQVCRAVFAAGRLVFVAEELSDVTTASFAPPAWRRITTQGRHAGLYVIGAAQRPTLIDKTFLANCTRVRVFQLGYDDDMRTMSKEVRAPVEELAALVTEERTDGKGAVINGLEYERRTRTLTRIRMEVGPRGVRVETAPFVVGETQKPATKRARKAGAM